MTVNLVGGQYIPVSTLGTTTRKKGTTMAKQATQPLTHTVDELSDALKVNHVTIRRMIRDKQLKTIRIGRVIRIPATELERILNGAA